MCEKGVVQEETNEKQVSVVAWPVLANVSANAGIIIPALKAGFLLCFDVLPDDGALCFVARPERSRPIGKTLEKTAGEKDRRSVKRWRDGQQKRKGTKKQ